MGKISLINIAEELAAKSGLGKDVADNFLHAFIETIEMGLNEDNLVKVKGLGTFKLLEVSDRGSIDVNTGERITIKGHTKVSFTPDNAMKEFVNRPFAHFEPTELNEGYTEEELVDPLSCIETDENEASVDAVATQFADDIAVSTDIPSVEVITVDAATPSVALHEETADAVTEVVQAEEQDVLSAEVDDAPSLDEAIEPAIESTDEAAAVIEDTDADVLEPSEAQLDDATEADRKSVV